MNRKPTLMGVAPAACTPLPTDPYERAVFVTTYADEFARGRDHDTALARAHSEVWAHRGPAYMFARSPAQGLPIGPK